MKIKLSIDHAEFVMSASFFEGINPNGRDNQRMRVYKSEWKAYPLIAQSRLVSTPELYIARFQEIWTSPFMAKNFPMSVAGSPVELKFSDKKHGATAWRSKILTGKHSMTELIMLHELAHVLVYRELARTLAWGQDGFAYKARLPPAGVGHRIHHVVGHGPEWVQIYLALVREFVGGIAFLTLRKKLIEGRVQIEPNRSVLPDFIFTEHEEEE